MLKIGEVTTRGLKRELYIPNKSSTENLCILTIDKSLKMCYNNNTIKVATYRKKKGKKIMKNTIVLVGNSIAELERDLAMCKVAMASGKTMGAGGSSMEDVEKALGGLCKALGIPTPPIPKREQVVCSCQCSYYADEDEDEDEYDYDDYYTEEDVDNIVESMTESELLDLISKATKELSERA